MRNQKHFSMTGKGYYIALVLCAAVIGVSGFLYYRNTEHGPGDTPAVQADSPDKATCPTGQGEKDRQEPQPPSVPKTLKTVCPVEGKALAGYAMDCLSYNETTRDWRTHNGVDLGAPAGTAVRAAAEGKVYTVYEDDALGKTVVIRHANGYVTRYASLSEDVTVSPGDSVSCGQTIGTVGSTALLETALGDHVHFSVSREDQSVDPAKFVSLP